MRTPRRTVDHTAVVAAMLQTMLTDADVGWNIGTFGAIGEFHHVDGDPPPVITYLHRGGEVITARGGIRVSARDDVLPIAFEGLSGRAGAWTQTMALCLLADVARLNRRRRLTELGPDRNALRDQDRTAIVFDLGVGAPHVDVFVRTADPNLIGVLRGVQGRDIFEENNPAVAAMVAASPHRIFASRLGRIEVYQSIPSATDGGQSPVGPHTHLLPDLLRRNRTHSANTPLPTGWLSAVNFHPSNPVTDRLGRPRPFDYPAYRAFQELIDRYGPPAFAAEKRRIRKAVHAGGSPASYVQATTRIGRTAARIALRQLQRTARNPEEVTAWLTAFDRGPGTCAAET